MAKKVEFRFNLEKSDKLRAERGIGFEEIIPMLDENHILAVEAHPNQQKYPNQKIYVVRVQEYAYLVPFVRDKDFIFLKTIIPSRKATARYLGKGG
ncbi:MAG: toxin [Deltaproteobacteria bacterium]|nr:toxin [Deltaproteobacteria bacterium]